MSFLIPTIVSFRDGFLFLELSSSLRDETENTSSQLVWTNGDDLLFSFEPVILQLIFPQFSTYTDLKIIAVESSNRFRLSSAIAISDFVFWLQNSSDITFGTFELMLDCFLASREINIRPNDYPLWLKRLEQQLPPTPFSAVIALTQLKNLDLRE